MTEQQLTRAIIEAINASGLAYVWRNQAGKIRKGKRVIVLAPEGTPDIVGYTREPFVFGEGYFVGLEVKLGKEKPTLAQMTFLMKSPGFCDVVRSVDEAMRLMITGTLRGSASDNTEGACIRPSRNGPQETVGVKGRVAGRRR